MTPLVSWLRSSDLDAEGMTPKPSGAAPQLVVSLARVAKRAPLERKVIVSPTVAAGRELLRRLSLTGAGWLGFEVTTPRPLSLRLARPLMDGAGRRALDPFESQALLDESMDRALTSHRGDLGALSDGVGFRDRAHGAIEALRLAGLDSGDLERARLPAWQKRRFLHQMLLQYERLLVERSRVDTAGIVALALEALESEGARMPATLGADMILLAPGLGTRGLTGQLLSALSGCGAKALETDAVIGIETPERVLWKPARRPGARSYFHAPTEAPDDLARPVTELFRAASINDELREVLRRVVGEGLSWDRVEIIAADPEAYGSALHALASRLRIPVTYAVGLPVVRTRTGRVVRSYLDWIEEGFQADPIRRLLEAGDLVPTRAHGRHAPAALARRFRELRVGWGRKRYRTQIRDALAAVDRMKRGRVESDEAFERRRERRRRELQALRSVLYPALRATPAVPDKMTERGDRVSPSEIARGLRAFLRRVPQGTGPDLAAREEVERILERVEATLVRRTDFGAAVTILRRHLDVRVRAGETVGGTPDESAAPWSSEGGHLHLADLEHGGFSGREAVFIVGLDADRVPGFGGQDPLLLDGERRILGPELPTSSELLGERLFRFGALLARLRGTLTLSYCAWDPTEARTLGPSPLLLQALRYDRHDPSLTFADLDAALGRAACSIPAPGRPSLDRDDVWMTELGRGEVLRAGTEVVCDAFPGLSQGFPAARERRIGTPGALHGVVEPRPEVLDPRRNADLVASASRLQQLGTCPLRYLHSTVLRIRPPDDPELDPERWLDPLKRGTLLHGVYERALRRARAAGVGFEDADFEALGMEALAAGITRMTAEVPVPGEGALRRETVGLEKDVRSFVRMVRERGAPWAKLELAFGPRAGLPVEMALEGGAVHLSGAIDRVDVDIEGARVIDYKTGLVWDLDGTGAFHGGRRLQHALYAHAAESLLGNEVVAGEYHFPTTRGENRAVVFARLELAGVGGLLETMLDGVAAGSFVPTEEADDCRFCDHAPICRVSVDSWGSVTSPLAEWSAEHLNAGVQPAFAHLKQSRTFEA